METINSGNNGKRKKRNLGETLSEILSMEDNASNGHSEYEKAKSAINWINIRTRMMETAVRFGMG